MKYKRKRQILSPISKFLIPAYCPCCGCGLIDESLGSCPACRKRLEESLISPEKRCELCFSPLPSKEEGGGRCKPEEHFCQGRKIFFDQHISLYQLNKDWGKLLYSWKFNGNRYLYQSFLTLLGQRGKELDSWQVERISYIDSGSRNLDLRAFQPCHDLALFLSKLWQVPLAKDLVKKKSKQQSKNDYAERFFAIHDALALSSDFPKPPPRNCLIVEDVYTSGATVNEAARTLKKAGVSKVYVLSMLKAERKISL